MHRRAARRDPSLMIVIERLTLRAWLLVVWPRLFRSRAARARMTPCYVIDASRHALAIARLLGRLAGVPVERLAFRMVDIRDETGLLMRLRIAYRDLAEVQAEVIAEPVFQEFLARYGRDTGLAAYAAKSVAMVHESDRTTLWRALLLVHVVRWAAANAEQTSEPILLLERRPWAGAIRRYAARHGVHVEMVKPAFDPGRAARRLVRPRGVSFARALRDKARHSQSVTPWRHRTPPADAPSAGADGMARIAVSYHGQFNLDDPSRYSDLFFWQESQLAGNDIVMLFQFPHDPLDAEKWRQLREHRIAAVALYPGAATVAEVPLHTRVPRLVGGARPPMPIPEAWRDIDAADLRHTLETYDELKADWAGLFERQHVKLYVTWNRFDAKHMAIADALRDVGGLTAIYQRAIQRDPGPEIAVHADVMFGYAPADAAVEQRSGSVIPYHVAVGYFGDHRFPLLRKRAAAIRAALREQGASHVVAFFDENSGDDSRWHTGHEFMRENYAFVLNQVLADPSLGVVLKPKYPSNLAHRLGPVAQLLHEAIQTGRCRLLGHGRLHGVDPPALAALAADVAIHGHLCAATAGFEAALAGVPTLLLDREGWHASPLYRLGEGQVVFRTWQELWRTLVEHRVRPGSIRGFGDWSPLMNDLDPYRDGRGAERVGTYLQWLLEGFKAGLDRDAAMARAAERFCRLWGADKISSVNTRRGAVTASPAPLLPV